MVWWVNDSCRRARNDDTLDCWGELMDGFQKVGRAFDGREDKVGDWICNVEVVWGGSVDYSGKRDDGLGRFDGLR